MYLAVSSAVLFDDPSSFSSQGLEDLIVVAVFRKLVVSVHPKTGVDLSSNCSASSLSPLVVFSLPPCGHPRPSHFLFKAAEALEAGSELLDFRKTAKNSSGIRKA